MEVEQRTRQRAPRYNAQFVRAAVTVVRPVNRQIGEWQSRVALLEALSKQPSAGPELTVRARELQHAVAAEQQAFGLKVKALPEQVATESRIADTQRALGTVMAAVERVLGRIT